MSLGQPHCCDMLGVAEGSEERAWEACVAVGKLGIYYLMTTFGL